MAQNIKLAYIVSCYKLPRQTIKLVDKILSKNDVVLIHIDKRSPKHVKQVIKNSLANKSNVHFLKSHNCRWGDFGHVKATIKGLNFLVEQSVEFDHLILLTGQDYPIKSMLDIKKYYQSNKSNSYMDYASFPMTVWANGGKDRIDKYHFWVGARHFAVPRVVKARLDLKFYGGSSYWSMTNEHSKVVYNYIKTHPRVVRYFKHTYISDEIFFQTLLLNLVDHNKVKNENLRYIDWSDPKEMPKLLDNSDISKLKSSKALFARKFDEQEDPKILHKVESVLGI